MLTTVWAMSLTGPRPWLSAQAVALGAALLDGALQPLSLRVREGRRSKVVALVGRDYAHRSLVLDGK